ncbi:hypothetical protein RB598_004374 [Gaeumannomyces tritici]
MAQTLDVAAAEGTICKLTKTCQDLFEGCMQTDRLSTSGWLEKRQGMFSLWSFALKASETGKQSLDYRVRSRPDVAEAIKDHIEGLIEALEQCKEIASTTEGELDSHPSHEQAGSFYALDQSEGSTDGQSPFWSEEGGDADDGDDDWQDPFFQQRLYITSIVDQLRRISTAIRKSGAKYRYERADQGFHEEVYQVLRNSMVIAFRTQQLWHPKFAKTEAERHSLAATYDPISESSRALSWETGSNFELGDKVESQPQPQIHLKPGAGVEAPRGTEVDVQALCRRLQDTWSLTPIQERLVRANILRHHRIIFFAEPARKHTTLLASRDRCEEQEPEREKVKLSEESGYNQASASVARLGGESASTPSESRKPISEEERPSRGQAGPSQVPATMMTASDLDIKGVTGPKWPPSHVTVGTAIQETQYYPRCPKALPDGPAKGMIQCPYCTEILPGEYEKEDRHWRSHVANDLIPYMCVFEDCDTPDDMYTSTFELTRHTIKAHGAPYWICGRCPAGSTDRIMGSPSKWVTHMRREHLGGFREAELPLLCDASRQTLIPPVDCPLCRASQDLPSETLDAHIAKHLHAFALLSLPWGSTEAAESDSDTDADMRPTIATDRSPGKHKVLDKAAILTWLNLTEIHFPVVQVLAELDASATQSVMVAHSMQPQEQQQLLAQQPQQQPQPTRVTQKSSPSLRPFPLPAYRPRPKGSDSPGIAGSSIDSFINRLGRPPNSWFGTEMDEGYIRKHAKKRGNLQRQEQQQLLAQQLQQLQQHAKEEEKQALHNIYPTPLNSIEYHDSYGIRGHSASNFERPTNSMIVGHSSSDVGGNLAFDFEDHSDLVSGGPPAYIEDGNAYDAGEGDFDSMEEGMRWDIGNAQGRPSGSRQ